MKNKYKTLLGITSLALLGCFYSIRPIYKEWYHDQWLKMAKCVGVDGTKVKQPFYFVIKKDEFYCPGGKCVGMYIPGFIFVSQKSTDDTNTVSHEQLHALGIIKERDVENKLERCLK